MKAKDKASLRAKNVEELTKLLADKKLEAAKSKAKVKAGSEKNLKKVKNLRSEIAVVSTILTEKALLKSEDSSDKQAGQRQDK